MIFFYKLHMKLIIIIFILVFYVFQVFSQSQQSFGYLKINYDSTGIEILLNNKPLGCTPLPIILLKPGIYKISALHPNPYLWGTFDWQDSIKIVSNDTLTIQPEFNKILHIITDPFDADIFLNNEYKGKSPAVISIYSQDSAQLVVKRAGYKDYVIDLKQVKNNSINVNLARNHDFSGLKNFKKQRKSKNRYKTLAYSFWGLSILSGLSTVYLKDQADEKYNQYLAAGSLKEMNNYYHDAKKYDRYTYISMGIMQGCFVLSFYFLMKVHSDI